MITDALLAFVPHGAPLSLIAGAGVDIASPNVIDLLGFGVGVDPASQGQIIGDATKWGSDQGIGSHRPELAVAIGTACTTGTSATLNVALQAAADQGSAGSWQPDTWKTIVETGELAASDLTAGKVIARFPWLPVFPDTLRPRFLRLLFQVPAATTFTAGTIAYALVTTGRDDYQAKFVPRNYKVA